MIFLCNKTYNTNVKCYLDSATGVQPPDMRI